VTAFSSRDSVGWLARSRSVSGSRPQTSFDQLQERIGAQTIRIVLILVAAGDLEDALANEHLPAVAN
jgi:hypothetical protein